MCILEGLGFNPSFRSLVHIQLIKTNLYKIKRIDIMIHENHIDIYIKMSIEKETCCLYTRSWIILNKLLMDRLAFWYDELHSLIFMLDLDTMVIKNMYAYMYVYTKLRNKFLFTCLMFIVLISNYDLNHWIYYIQCIDLFVFMHRS